MYPPVKIILCLAPCSIIKNLQYNKFKGYMPSQNLHNYLSRTRKYLKNTHRPLKNTCGRTSKIIQSGRVQNIENILKIVTNTMRK